MSHEEHDDISRRAPMSCAWVTKYKVQMTCG